MNIKPLLPLLFFSCTSQASPPSLKNFSPEVTELIQNYIQTHEPLPSFSPEEMEALTPAMAAAAAGAVGWAVGEKIYASVKGANTPYDEKELDLPTRFDLPNPDQHPQKEATPVAFAAGFVGGLAYAAAKDALGNKDLEAVPVPPIHFLEKFDLH